MLDDTNFVGVRADTLELSYTKFLMRHFAAPETQSDFHLIAFGYELANLSHLDLIVVLVGLRSQFDLFNFNLLLLRLCLRQSLSFLELELSKVHDPAHWRLRGWRDFHQIKLSVFGHRKRFAKRFDAGLLTVFIYQSNLGSGDLTVDSIFFIGYVTTPICNYVRLRSKVGTRFIFGNAEFDELFNRHHAEIDVSAAAYCDSARFSLFCATYSNVRELL